MFAPDTPARESGGYPQPGAVQDIANHPDNSLPDPGLPNMTHSLQMAGDVIPIRPNGLESDISTSMAQVKNERSMKNISDRGASAVDPNNLTMYRKK